MPDVRAVGLDLTTFSDVMTGRLSGLPLPHRLMGPLKAPSIRPGDTLAFYVGPHGKKREAATATCVAADIIRPGALIFWGGVYSPVTEPAIERMVQRLGYATYESFRDAWLARCRTETNEALLITWKDLQSTTAGVCPASASSSRCTT